MPVKDMRKTFQENREFVLGLIGTEWTKSADIFKGGEAKRITRHLKRALADELIIVNRVSRNEVYYKKNPTEVELNLMKVIESARQIMAEVKALDAEYAEKLHTQIQEGMMGMPELTAELSAFERQKSMLDECLERLRRVYQGVGSEVPLGHEVSWESVRAIVTQPEIHAYQADGYELTAMRDDGQFLMEKKVGTGGTGLLRTMSPSLPDETGVATG